MSHSFSTETTAGAAVSAAYLGACWITGVFDAQEHAAAAVVFRGVVEAGRRARGKGRETPPGGCAE